MRIARFAKGDGVAYGVVEGENGQPQTIAELYGHPFGVDPAGVRFTGNQCWDLLRQRRAKREFGEGTEGTAVRPVSEVEGYQQ